MPIPYRESGVNRNLVSPEWDLGTWRTILLTLYSPTEGGNLASSKSGYPYSSTGNMVYYTKFTFPSGNNSLFQDNVLDSIGYFLVFKQIDLIFEDNIRFKSGNKI